MDTFNQRKKDILLKIDKSAKGSWDFRIVDLCEKINRMNDYYTTSSCSGKCVIMEEKSGKDGSYYLWESHEFLDLKELKKVISTKNSVLSTKYSVPSTKNLVKNAVLKFKLQSPILFVVCKDISHAEKIFNLARESGFKETGIHITKKLIGVEIRSGEKLEFPLIDSGGVLVGEKFLEVLVKEVNRKLEFGWEKLEKLGKAISTQYSVLSTKY